MSDREKANPNKQLLAICSSQGEAMSTAIALEAQNIVREAAGNTQGLIVKGQIRQSARNLGYPQDSWRVREAWYGGAGAWSAAAIRDLQSKFLAWRGREAARAQHEQFLRAQRDREHLEAVREECRITLQDIERQLALVESVLGPSDPHLDR